MNNSNDNYINVIKQALDIACTKGCYNLQNSKTIGLAFESFIEIHRNLEREIVSLRSNQDKVETELVEEDVNLKVYPKLKQK